MLDQFVKGIIIGLSLANFKGDKIHDILTNLKYDVGRCTVFSVIKDYRESNLGPQRYSPGRPPIIDKTIGKKMVE